MMSTPLHIILKWNEMPFFHTSAPDTIYEHAKILKQYFGARETYVWWGKVSVSGCLGNLDKFINVINQQISVTDTYLYLYCPDSPYPSMHVGKLEEVSVEDHLFSPHTPEYYRDVGKHYNIPYWFKLSDIVRIPLRETLCNLHKINGTQFDPVSVNYYPMVVYSSVVTNYFPNSSMFLSLIGGHEMKCFKTGHDCSCSNSIVYNPKQVFIGCPFQASILNMVTYVIKPVVQKMAMVPWIACDNKSNIDIMCKICQAIQSSGQAIIDITGWNANVLFELGLLYGNGKKVLLIKQKGENTPIDLSGIEYIEYDISDFSVLEYNLQSYFQNNYSLI